MHARKYTRATHVRTHAHIAHLFTHTRARARSSAYLHTNAAAPAGRFPSPFPLQNEAAELQQQLLNSTLAVSIPSDLKGSLTGSGIAVSALIISRSLLQLVQVCCAISFRRAIASGAYADAEDEDASLTNEKKSKKFDATVSKLSKM